MTDPPRPRVAVVGHVEWITHGIGLMPRPGEIRPGRPVRGARRRRRRERGPGGRLGRRRSSLRARLGRAGPGERRAPGESRGDRARRGPRRQTRGVAAVDESADRAILIIGGPTSARIDDQLPWEDIAACDAAYFTGHDSATVAAARRARSLVVSSRRLAELVESGVRADVLIASAGDPSRRSTPTGCRCRPARSSGPRAATAAASPPRTAAAAAGTRPRSRARPWTATAAATVRGRPHGRPGPRPLDGEALALGACCGAHCSRARALAAQTRAGPAHPRVDPGGRRG